MNPDSLQQLFLTGTQPKSLQGFYKGSLAAFIPGSFPEQIGGVFLQLYLPWRGKYFNNQNHTGNNLVHSYLGPFLQFRYKKVLSMQPDGLHIFPFKTTHEQGLLDTIRVLRLDYDLPENPPFVRTVVDELVEVEKNNFLGKAHVKHNSSIRTVAFFRLKK